jgi:hypothetical protein
MDNLFRKGFESNLVYEKVKELEHGEGKFTPL